jgi:hypothetical protein
MLQETYLMHTFDDDFYGSKLKVIMLGYIRPMKDFSSLGEFMSLHFQTFTQHSKTTKWPLSLKKKQIDYLIVFPLRIFHSSWNITILVRDLHCTENIEWLLIVLCLAQEFFLWRHHRFKLIFIMHCDTNHLKYELLQWCKFLCLSSKKGGHIALPLSVGPSAVSVHFLRTGCAYWNEIWYTDLS